MLLSVLWPAALSGLHSPVLAMSFLILLLPTAATTLIAFRRLQPGAALLLLPYLAWLCCIALMSADRFWLDAI